MKEKITSDARGGKIRVVMDGFIIISFAEFSVGTYIDLRVTLYKTDMMQRCLAESYAKEYKRLEYEYQHDANLNR